MSPADLVTPDWIRARDVGKIAERVENYSYSSLADHTGVSRTQNALVGPEVFRMYRSPQSLATMLFDAQSYNPGGFV
jgi:hypothetical protein